jgi:hypothetical protein
MVGGKAADVIKQGQGTIRLVVNVGNISTSVPTPEGGGAFVGALYFVDYCSQIFAFTAFNAFS